MVLYFLVGGRQIRTELGKHLTPIQALACVQSDHR